MHVLIVGGSRADRLRAALAQEHPVHPDPSEPLRLDALSLPFVRASAARLQLPPGRPRLVRVDDLESAFPNTQSSGARLILTQSTYLLQTWLDAIEEGDRIIATADREALAGNAPEAFARRGPWRHFSIIELPGVGPGLSTEPLERDSVSDHVVFADSAVEHFSRVEALLVRAFHLASFEERLAICRDAQALAPDSAVVALAVASACREQADLSGARRALDDALRVAPDWEAVYFEDGKFWLGTDDMARARDAFQRAADLMPTFSAAFSNLGGTLGELDEPEAAAAAFSCALKHDPDSFTTWNNIGVVNRELGRLEESEQALVRVTELSPGFVFGHYNLGHTRFLRGDYRGALSAYEEGQRRDPEKNRRQGCRLALVRFAIDDMEGAERDLWRFANAAPADEREDLLLEAYEIGHALIQAHPHLAIRQEFLDRIAAELTLE